MARYKLVNLDHHGIEAMGGEPFDTDFFHIYDMDAPTRTCPITKQEQHPLVFHGPMSAAREWMLNHA